MADASPGPRFDTSFDPDTGRPVAVAPGVVRITAGNRSAFTFTGTNSFLIGGDRLAVLDPGPDDVGHRSALLAAIGGRPVEAIILTHTHKDHSAGARSLVAATNAPLWFAGPHRLSRPARPFEPNAIGSACDWSLRPDRTLHDGERFEIGGVRLAAVTTPGHCANHMSFGVEGADALLSGDHVMGWNSTLVSVPDGSMADYLASLRKVIALPYRRHLPAHGGPVEDGPALARALLAHRQLRNAQVADAVRGGATRLRDLVAKIYPRLSGPLRFAAGLTLAAHIEYLEDTGVIAVRRSPFGMRLRPA
ncbi:MAG: MBL fold metallo-hydrolase [Devosia sp.]